MKRVFGLALALVASALISTSADAQQKVCRAQSPTILCKGDYSSGLPTTAVKSFSAGAVPLYTRLDSSAGAVSDTFKWTPTGDYNSVAFHHDFYQAAGSGTPTITASCYVSGNNGASYDLTAIAAYTVNPTSLTVPIAKVTLINNGAGNPHTSYMWVFGNSASTTTSHKGWVTPK